MQQPLFQRSICISLLSQQKVMEFKKLNLSLISAIPIKKVKNEVLDYFLKKGIINGSEVFASSRKPPVLEGIENQDLYEQDSKLLISSLNNRNNFVDKLINWEFVESLLD